jgi:hypothetical protein
MSVDNELISAPLNTDEVTQCGTETIASENHGDDQGSPAMAVEQREPEAPLITENNRTKPAATPATLATVGALASTVAASIQPPSTERKSRTFYPALCKQAVLQVDKAKGPKATATMFELNVTLIGRWRNAFPAAAAYQGPADDAEPRTLDILKELNPNERNPAENLMIYRHYVQLPAGKKRQLNRKANGKSAQLKSSDGSSEGFQDFWLADGEGEAYLNEIEKIVESELDEKVAMQLEKRIDENISVAGKALIDSSMDFIVKMRMDTKSKATHDAWNPRKKRFLVSQTDKHRTAPY